MRVMTSGKEVGRSDVLSLSYCPKVQRGLGVLDIKTGCGISFVERERLCVLVIPLPNPRGGEGTRRGRDGGPDDFGRVGRTLVLLLPLHDSYHLGGGTLVAGSRSGRVQSGRRSGGSSPLLEDPLFGTTWPQRQQTSVSGTCRTISNLKFLSLIKRSPFIVSSKVLFRSFFY